VGYTRCKVFEVTIRVLGGGLDRARRMQESGFRMWPLHGAEPEALDFDAVVLNTEAHPLRRTWRECRQRTRRVGAR
jgi:mannosidase alpha-like ER degradation enhancer 2